MGKVIYNGRYSAKPGEEVVVFIIGMRINKWRSIHKWLPVFKAMPAMIKELYQNKELGFLHTEYGISWRKITLIQYWRSFEDLTEYARGHKHLNAWKNFNKKIGSDGSVGIFHETYYAKKGQYESLYGNMPKEGLATAIGHTPLNKKTQTAKDRMSSS